ncbi:MAG: phytoene desaturase family protein [Anaerolineae bacterium]
MNHPIIVIGAGIGGLSAAIHLVSAGARVHVLEQNDHVGGKMGRLETAGFTWDTGPSVITMRHVFEELFAAAGRNLADYLTLEPVEPLTHYVYPDGTIFDATRDLPRLLAQVEAIEPRDVEGLLRFLSHAAALHRITGDVFIYGEPPTLRDILGVPLRDLPQVDAWRTMHRAVRAYVRSPKLRQLLGRFATYVGASPYRAPAVLNVIAHVEINQGVWYPVGGVYTIAEALQRLAEELGITVTTGARVGQINVTDGRATGVTLDDGTRLAARAVLANVDVATVYAELLSGDVVPAWRRRRFTRMPPSGSGFVMLLGVEGEHPDLAQHNIFFSSDYRREFADIFQRGIPPREATIYVTITSKRDPVHAPPGCENWFVLVNAPPLGSGFDWRAEAEAYGNALLAQLAAFGYDVRDRLRVRHTLTPEEIRDQTGAWRGALYGVSSNNPLAALRRPPNRSHDVQGLYFAGGTTHPGGGVPMVTLSGRTAARMVLEDLKKR